SSPSRRSGARSCASSGLKERNRKSASETYSLEIRLWVVSTVRRRASGDPGDKLADAETGPPLPRGRTGTTQRTNSTYSIVKQPSLSGPSFGRAWGRPVSFPSPQVRGMARREGALSGFRRTARIRLSGGPGSPDPDAHDACVRALSARHRGIFPLARFRRSDLPQSIVLQRGCPSAARGRGYVDHVRGCRPRPTFTTPHEAPLDGRDVHDLW